VALERVFRVGFSLTLQLAQLAQTLTQKGQIQAGATPLLGPPYDELIAGLRRRRPELGARPFVTLADVSQAAALLDEAARIPPAVMGALGLSFADLEKRVAADPSVTYASLVHEWADDGDPAARRATLIERGAPHWWVTDTIPE
jgi:hypothetical protein